MKTIIVIPARYASARLPGKALLKETGKYLIEHVYEATSKSIKADKIIVATDDIRIKEAVESFGGEAHMTKASHQSGTDRMAEVASKVEGDIFVNVQGDEPEVNAQVIDQVIGMLETSKDADVATLAYTMSSEEANTPHVVKVVCDNRHYALYFSRSKIPYTRDNGAQIDYWGHIGLYAYRRAFLQTYTSFPPSRLENIERLEQLRVLENGYKIRVGLTNYRSHGIDTPEDYQKFVQRCNL